MKKFIINILIFFGIVAVLDVAAGKVFWYLQSSKAGGRTGAEYYACKESNEDVIIMGSSRASHHYVPQIITDSLGLSCFNAGQDGNGIILQYGRWKMISERYTPKVIIYDVTVGLDLMASDNTAYIDHLKPFFDDQGVKEYITGLYPMENLKLMSRMYRYNYKFLEVFADCMKQKDSNNGYIPLYGQIRQEVVDGYDPSASIPTISYDEIKMMYFKKFIDECKEKGTSLIMVASPAYMGGGYDRTTYEPIIDLAEQNQIPFFYYNESDFSEQPKLFKDSGHLNHGGALLYTSEVAHWINL